MAEMKHSIKNLLNLGDEEDLAPQDSSSSTTTPAVAGPSSASAEVYINDPLEGTSSDYSAFFEAVPQQVTVSEDTSNGSGNNGRRKNRRAKKRPMRYDDSGEYFFV